MSWWDEAVDRLVPSWASPPLFPLFSLLFCLFTYLLAQAWFVGRLATSSPVLVFWLSPFDSGTGSTIIPASAGQNPPPEPAPALLYLLIALCFFGHQTLERAELRQTRRLRFCSAAAEFFSHACLTLASPFLLLLLANSLQLSPSSPTSPILLLACLVGAHLLAYQHLLFGECPAVVAFLLASARPAMAVVALLTCLFGEGFWLQELFAEGFRVNSLVVLGAALFLALLVADFARRVASHSRTAGVPLLRIAAPLVPHSALIACSCLWLLVDFPFLMEEELHLLVLAVGLLHCYLVTRLFLDRTAKQSQGGPTAWIVLPLALCLLAYLAPLSGYDVEPLVEPHRLVQLCLLLAAINYAQFAGQVIFHLSAQAPFQLFKADYSSRLLPLKV